MIHSERCTSWHLGLYDEALDAARAALTLEPDNQRLQNNLKIMRCSHDSKSK